MTSGPRVLCCSCASVLKTDAEPPKQCPCCNSVMSTQEYQRIIKYARVAVRFGFQYRQRYETSIPKEPELRFSLPEVSATVTFLALAALTGIVGGMAHDAVKSLMRKIASNDTTSRGGTPDQEALSITKDDDAIQEFYSHIAEYVSDGFENLDPKVRKVIREEILVSYCSDTLTELNRDSIYDLTDPKFSKEIQGNIRELLTLAMKRVMEDRRPLTEDDFRGMWKNVDWMA